jgi:hypothetical protein
VRVVSPDGRWLFDGDRIRGDGTAERPEAIDFFERWTFARFLGDGVLALAFESGQPWAEYGSYGDRYGGVQVMVYGPDGPGWTCRALEYDYRAHDERFEPSDVVWHPRGVLAWVDESLYVQVLRTPRVTTSIHDRDSDTGPYWSYEPAGVWRSVSLDETGRMCRAEGDDGFLVLDLEQRRSSTDGITWDPIR